MALTGLNTQTTPEAEDAPAPDLDAIRKRLGQRIRRQREKKGYSQGVLAELSGLNRSYIGALERGEHNPGINNIVRVAHGLGMSLEQLFSEPQPGTAPRPAPTVTSIPTRQPGISRRQFMQLLRQCTGDRPDLVVIYLERFGIRFAD